MLDQLQSEVLRMLQEGSRWDFGGDSPVPFLHGYMTAICVRRGHSYRTILHAAQYLVDQHLCPRVNAEVQDAVRAMR